MKNDPYDWVDFYKEFARKLLDYKDNRAELIEKVESIFDRTGINMPTLEKDNQIVDIDPFTIFGLFNKKIHLDNRIKIVSAIADIFDVQAATPTSFDSIPVLNNLNAIFYRFVDDRSDNDFDDLWRLFDVALKFAENPSTENRETFSRDFDVVMNKKGIGNSKITMALFWIAPNFYLNLDSRNVWYIYKSGKLPKELIDSLPEIEVKIPSSKYLDIAEKLRTYLVGADITMNDFKDLSLDAWHYSEEVNEINREKKLKSQRDDKGSALADEDVDTVHYWMYSPGDYANKWEEYYQKGVMRLDWDEIGDLRQYASKDEMKMAMREAIDPSLSYKNAAHATWQFVNEMKPGDVVFVKRGTRQLLGRGIVKSDYVFDDSEDPEFPNYREVEWIDKGEWDHPGIAVTKTLTDITPYTDYVAQLNALFDTDEVNDSIEILDTSYPPYSVEKFLQEVYMDEKSYNNLVSLIRNKKNVILQGVPGVGKTFVAKRLAYSMMGLKDQERFMMVQFHQSYSYEDFIEGFRPSSTGDGFIIKKGSFYKFCKKAADDIENEYFFIIDEINRGNLSKILGELFMLIEKDKRGNPLKLLYSDEKFLVPSNVYIIGMMNTADRSLAMLDYALRRRFAFYEMKPAFDSKGFIEYRMDKNNDAFNKLIDQVIILNRAIAEDDSLGENFCIGHSYFCDLEEINEDVLLNIVEYEIIPLLKEYWFDEPLKVKDWSSRLRSSVN